MAEDATRPATEYGERLRICLATAELTPFAKTGGLGDVAAALARYLHRDGQEVRAFLPLYSSIDASEHHFVPVDFAQEVPVEMGSRHYSFSLFTAPLPGSRLGLYFVHCPALYDRPGIYTGDGEDALRYAFLCRAILESCQRMGWGPQVFHLNDWHTALLPIFLRSQYHWDGLFRESRTVLTLHNVGYQGIFGAEMLRKIGLDGAASLFYQEDLQAGRVNFLKSGILYAGALTTVSRTHAQEIQSEQYGMGLERLLRARSDHLVGIVNGIDHEEWNPADDPHIPHAYSIDEMEGKALNKQALQDGLGISTEADVPLVGIVTRLTAQKGLDLLFEALPRMLERRPFSLAVLGSGERRYEEFFERLRHAWPGRVGFFRGFNNPLAHLIEAGSDIFLMPSLYEPCGLNQMYSQRYGTVPVVRRTGGLADTVQHFDPSTGIGTGFVFEHYTPEGLAWALGQALDTYNHPTAWRRLVHSGMSQDFSWERQIQKYLALYRALIRGA